MKVHDWTRVDDSTFHDFHTSWITHLKETLNGILPQGYYAKSEQHIGRKVGDVLALHASDPDWIPEAPEPPEGGTVAVAEAPPKVSRTLVADLETRDKRRTLTIRHTTGHRIIALVEILSSANKSSADGVAEFLLKAAGALRSRIHLVLLDLLPPGRHDPRGMHAALWDDLGQEEDETADDKPLTLASYSAGPPVTAYLEHLAVGDPLKDMPLFLTSKRYVNLPLTPTYAAAVRGMPGFWREVLEGRPPASGGRPAAEKSSRRRSSR